MKRAFLLILTLVLIGGTVTGFVRYRHAMVSLVPAAWREPTFTFAVMGDTESHTDLYEQALAEAKARGAMLMIHTGDISDGGTADQFKALAAITNKSGVTVRVAVGNHDIAVDDTRALFASYFNTPNIAFDQGGLRFVILDNAHRTVGFSTATLAWLKKEIADNPHARYVIAYHRPFDIPFGSIVGDDETTASRKTNTEFKNLISKATVIAIFNGHLHTYLPYTINGIPTYITGGGGGPVQLGLAAFTKSAHHFLLVRVTGSTLHAETVKLD